MPGPSNGEPGDDRARVALPACPPDLDSTSSKGEVEDADIERRVTRAAEAAYGAPGRLRAPPAEDAVSARERLLPPAVCRGDSSDGDLLARVGAEGGGLSASTRTRQPLTALHFADQRPRGRLRGATPGRKRAAPREGG